MSKVQNAISLVTAYARPKRIAFLIDPERTNNNELDQIIRFCVCTWGGRFFPIIPTSGKTITADWWRLLELVDPDIIYSLIALEDGLVRLLDRNVLPSEIIEMDEKERTHGGESNLIRSHGVAALGVEESVAVRALHLTVPLLYLPR